MECFKYFNRTIVWNFIKEWLRNYTDIEHGTEVKKHCRSDLVLRYKHLLLEDFCHFYTSLVGITTLYSWYVKRERMLLQDVWLNSLIWSLIPGWMRKTAESSFFSKSYFSMINNRAIHKTVFKWFNKKTFACTMLKSHYEVIIQEILVKWIDILLQIYEIMSYLAEKWRMH